MYKNSKIYVAGHTGLIGSALMRKLKEHNCDNIITKTHKELELTDKKAVFDFFSTAANILQQLPATPKQYSLLLPTSSIVRAK